MNNNSNNSNELKNDNSKDKYIEIEEEKMINDTFEKLEKEQKSRIRPAMDFSFLNQFVMDRKCIMPLIDEIIDRLAFKGQFLLGDIANYFESFLLAVRDQVYTHFESPIGGMIMKTAGYGHKLIMPLGQGYAVDTVKTLTKLFAVFVDDLAIRLNDVNTIDELCEFVEPFLDRFIERGLKLNPEKLYILCHR